MERLLNKINEADGFSYAELMAGMAVLLVAIGIFTSIYRQSNMNRVAAAEQTAMATAAQNMAEVYRATPVNAKAAAEAEGAREGFTVSINESAPDSSGLINVTITVRSRYYDRYPENHPLHLKDFVLVFQSLEKSKFR